MDQKSNDTASNAPVFKKPQLWTDQEWNSLLLSGAGGWSMGQSEMIDLIRRLGNSKRLQRTAVAHVEEFIHFERIILHFRHEMEFEAVRLNLVESPLGGRKMRQLLFAYPDEMVTCRLQISVCDVGKRHKPTYECRITPNVEYPQWSGDADSSNSMFNNPKSFHDVFHSEAFCNGAATLSSYIDGMIDQDPGLLECSDDSHLSNTDMDSAIVLRKVLGFGSLFVSRGIEDNNTASGRYVSDMASLVADVKKKRSDNPFILDI